MRILLAPVAAFTLLVVMTGCTPAPSPSPSQSPAPSASASAAPSASPSSPAEEPADLPVPSCEQLVTPDAMYDYNSNVAFTPGYAPPAGGVIARVAASGVACGWTNLSSGEVIAVAVGAPDAAARDAFTTEFASWGATSWGGTSGYFGVAGAEGRAAVVSDGYVVVSVSTTYVEAGDAEPIVDAALDAI